MLALARNCDNDCLKLRCIRRSRHRNSHCKVNYAQCGADCSANMVVNLVVAGLQALIFPQPCIALSDLSSVDIGASRQVMITRMRSA